MKFSLCFSILFSVIWSVASLTGCSPAGSSVSGTSDPSFSREYYEWRTYHLSSQTQQNHVLSYLKNAALPTLNRLGITPVGVFTEMDTAKGLNVHLLIPYKSLNQFAETPIKMMADPQYSTAGAAYLDLENPEDKAYDRVESRLLAAFDSMPHIAVPKAKTAGRSHFFELRSYESFSEKKGLSKISMFNEGREVAIFQKLGFDPVFFSQAITGTEQPNLVYMITYDDMESKDELWNKFRTDPAWEAIKDLPEYANTVSKIHSHLLLPTDFSQL